MYTGDGRRYFSVGMSAIRCVDDALRTCDLADPTTILDLPCGFGRVMRVLAARFPDAKITACDIRPRAVAFCVRRFKAEGVISARDFDELRFGRQFDLIWCGSLLTHMNAAQSLALLDLFARSARVGGLCCSRPTARASPAASPRVTLPTCSRHRTLDRLPRLTSKSGTATPIIRGNLATASR